MAIAMPRPDDAPVTNTILPFSAPNGFVRSAKSPSRTAGPTTAVMNVLKDMRRTQRSSNDALTAEVEDKRYLRINGLQPTARITDPTGLEVQLDMEWTVDESEQGVR